MDTAVRQPRRWTRAEYEWLIAQGAFQPGERLELIDGEIVTMTPQKSQHAAAVQLVHLALNAVFGSGYSIRSQLPLALTAASEPEPDAAVVTGSPRDYVTQHPTSALLIVEIADTSLRFDRQVKGPLYANAGITDYWILNLIDNVLEVYREPEQRAGEWAYRLVSRHGPGELVAPLAAPGAPVPVTDLLP